MSIERLLSIASRAKLLLTAYKRRRITKIYLGKTKTLRYAHKQKQVRIMSTTRVEPSVKQLATELAAEVRCYATDASGNSNGAALASAFTNVVRIEHGMDPEVLDCELWLIYRDASSSPSRTMDLNKIAADLDKIGARP